jgi:hypothetical protein
LKNSILRIPRKLATAKCAWQTTVFESSATMSAWNKHTFHAFTSKKRWQHRRRAEHVPNKVMEKVKELQQWKLFQFRIQCRGRFVLAHFLALSEIHL